MIKTISKKENYIRACDVAKLPITYENRKHVRLFGHDVRLEDDPWLWHFHIKITDACNARCGFCIEQNCKRNEKADHALENIERMLTEMEKKKCLFSVSVTGGEPTLFPKFDKLCDILETHDISFLTMNTNGYGLEKYRSRIDGLFDWVNISRHSASDEENNSIFRTHVPSIAELKSTIDGYRKTKFRIQCVIGNTIHAVDDLLAFMDAYRDVANDFSFRRLMRAGDEFGLDYVVNNDEYFSILNYAYENWTFKTQAIQDYYIYEIWNNGKSDVTFSYSDMKLLRETEAKEDENIFREFICHPDGTVSGSWKKDCKIILE